MVGKPSAGKSTFFKAATLAEVDIANYPFTTIKPNTGVGFVKIKDAAKEFNKTANPREGFILGDYRFVPCDLIDVAGLVPGAHEGLGMGNQFLDDLRQADALVHVVDISGSTNEKGEPVDAGSHDPAKDIKFLEDELDLWYLGILKKGWEKFARTVVQTKGSIAAALGKQLSAFKVGEDMAKEVIKQLKLDPEKPNDWSEDQLLELAREFRRRTKPIVIAANKIDMGSGKENYERLKKEHAALIIVPCSAVSELALKEAAKAGNIDYIPGEKDFTIKGELNDKQKQGLEYIKENVLKTFGSTGVQDVLNAAVFDLLKYKAIHPGGVSKLEDSQGNVLPDCFLLPEKATALDFAFKLHTDFGKNFIKAIDVKTKLPIGKDHILKHLDVIEIKSNA